MNAQKDADDHLAVVKNFMDGKTTRETRRITRDLSTRINPIHLTTALASVLPHVAKDDETGNQFVGVVFTRETVLLVASSGNSVIACRVPAIDGAEVTGDVVADSIIILPVMAKQLMGFAGLTPKESWDPQTEITITGTGPESLRLKATDRTGLFEGKSLLLPVQEPTKNLARALQILESMSVATIGRTKTHDLPNDALSAFTTSAKKWESGLEIESVTSTMWRVRCSTLFYGVISAGINGEELQGKIDQRHVEDRDKWTGALAGVGQELVRGLEGQ